MSDFLKRVAERHPTILARYIKPTKGTQVRTRTQSRIQTINGAPLTIYSDQTLDVLHSSKDTVDFTVDGGTVHTVYMNTWQRLMMSPNRVTAAVKLPVMSPRAALPKIKSEFGKGPEACEIHVYRNEEHYQKSGKDHNSLYDFIPFEKAQGKAKAGQVWDVFVYQDSSISNLLGNLTFVVK